MFVVFQMNRRTGSLREELSVLSMLIAHAALCHSVRTDSSALGLNSLVCVLMPRFVAAFYEWLGWSANKPVAEVYETRSRDGFARGRHRSGHPRTQLQFVPLRSDGLRG